MEDIIQFKATLQWTKPPIWRRLLVSRKTTFMDFHYILQIAFNWQNSHLFEFRDGKVNIGLKDDGFFTMDGGPEVTDAETITLEEIFTKPKQKIEYEYDFGDSWDHEIEAEKFLPREPGMQIPGCTDGKQNGPPEDCGGVPGFYDLLEILANKEHPEHKEIKEWLEEDYDQKYFSQSDVNQNLKAFAKEAGIDKP